MGPRYSPNCRLGYPWAYVEQLFHPVPFISACHLIDVLVPMSIRHKFACVKVKLTSLICPSSVQARTVAQWLKCSPFKRMVWGSIPSLATKWVAMVTLNMCGWDNMSLVA